MVNDGDMAPKETTFNGYACRHFSLTNGDGKHASDLPRLLRRVASEIEEMAITPMDLMDLTIHHEMTTNGPSWSATVYF